MEIGPSRRSFLGALGGGLCTAVAGCVGSGGSVSVLAAGSLATTLERYVGPAFEAEGDVDVHGEYHGSNAVMRMIEDGQKHPDVAISADVGLLRDRLYPDYTEWDVEFASNVLGIAYAEETATADRLADGDPWYEVLADLEAGELAISDPDLDPLGYRSIQAFELAEAEYGLDGLRDRLLEHAYLEPDEPQLLAGVTSGNRAAAIAYRNMAVDHDVPFLAFPDRYNFANHEYAGHYASVTYTTDDGYAIEGSPIVYNATVLEAADEPDAGQEFVQFLGRSTTLLEEAGLEPDGHPSPHGSVPAEVIDP